MEYSVATETETNFYTKQVFIIVDLYKFAFFLVLHSILIYDLIVSLALFSIENREFSCAIGNKNDITNVLLQCTTEQ